MIDLTTLTDDGDTLKLDDGRMLRLRIRPDDGASVNDYDSDGRVEWVRGDRDWSPMRYPRPEGFNGLARIIERDNDSALWWQPPGKEITGSGWDAETMRKERERIQDLCRFGFMGLVLELCSGVDAYGRPIVVDVASLWSIEWNVDDAYKQEVIGDLFSELI